MDERKQSFFSLLRQSVYAPKFYDGLLSKPLSFSLKYFFLLILLVAFVYTATFSVRFGISINSFAKRLGPTIVKHWPDDLEVVVKNGRASTNAEEPYVIPFPKEFFEGARQPSDPIEHILVIDTTRPFNLDRFYSFNTVFLLTKDTVAVSSQKSVRLTPLASLPDMTANKISVDNFVATYIEPFARFAMPILVGGTFLLMLITQSLSLLYLLAFAFLAWAITKIKKFPASYKKSFQISLHAATAGKLANVFLLGMLDVRIPFLFTVLALLAAWFNLRPRTQQPASNLEEPASAV